MSGRTVFPICLTRPASRRLLVLALATAIVAGGGTTVLGRDTSQALQPLGAPWRVEGTFDGDKQEPISRDISGIACLPASDRAVRQCLVVDDQVRFAQFATVGQDLVTAGHRVGLIGKDASDATLGRIPPDRRRKCSGGDGGFKDLDGEGVSYATPYFYVVGSHGCSRHSSKFRSSSFILARFAPGERIGKKRQEVETTWRLSEAILSRPSVARFFAADLDGQNGLNIEGVAVVGNRLFAGLRAPSIDSNAFLVGVPVADLFAPGHDALGEDPEPVFRDAIPLRLGANVGIRDLAALPDGRLLVLAGPAQEQNDVPFALHVVDPMRPGSLKKLALLAPVPVPGKPGSVAKAEAVLPLGRDRVLILFDGLPNGGPREYAVPLN